MNATLRTSLRYFLAGLSGLLAAAAFPDLGWWPLILLAPPVLMLALRGAGLRHGLYLGLLQGMVCYGTGLSWMTRIFGSGALVLWFLMAAYGMLGGGLIGLGCFRPAPVVADDPGIPVLAVQSEHCDFYRYLDLTAAHPFQNGIILWPEYATVFELQADPIAYAKACKSATPR